jgi:glyoxylase-like metal-dependent hydrolase (beta-lactamase superfamily II)
MLRCTIPVHARRPARFAVPFAQASPLPQPSMTAPLPTLLEFPVPHPPAPGEAIEIAPRLRWLRMPLPFALDHINLWLLDDDDGATTLIDCGVGNDATRALWERHFATTLDGRPIRRIVATHSHPDHVGNAAWLAARFGVLVAMTHAEYLAAHAMAGQHSGYTVDAMLDLFARHGMAEHPLESLGKRGNTYRRFVPELPERFDRLLDGDTRKAGGTAWRVVEGHGHSPEHASLYSAERNVLVSGDMLLPRISTNVAVWPSDPDGDPLGRFLRSLASFEALPDTSLVLPSHGLPFRGIAMRVAQLRAHHEDRLAELFDAVAAAASPVSAAQVVPVLFRRDLDVHQRFFAMGEAIAHLNHLWRGGRIRRLRAADGACRFAASLP